MGLITLTPQLVSFVNCRVICTFPNYKSYFCVRSLLCFQLLLPFLLLVTKRDDVPNFNSARNDCRSLSSSFCTKEGYHLHHLNDGHAQLESSHSIPTRALAHFRTIPCWTGQCLFCLYLSPSLLVHYSSPASIWYEMPRNERLFPFWSVCYVSALPDCFFSLMNILGWKMCCAIFIDE